MSKYTNRLIIGSYNIRKIYKMNIIYGAIRYNHRFCLSVADFSTRNEKLMQLNHVFSREKSYFLVKNLTFVLQRGKIGIFILSRCFFNELLLQRKAPSLSFFHSDLTHVTFLSRTPLRLLPPVIKYYIF